MFPAWARMLVAMVFAWFALAALRDGQTFVGVVAIVLSSLMLLAWLRYHDIRRVERAFNMHDRDRAWSLLAGVPFGGRFLRHEARVYYHHVKSLCLQRGERWEEAAREAEAAVRVAAAGKEAPGCHLAAAQAYVHLNDLEAARRHAEAARALPHGEAVSKGLARIDRLLEPQASA